MDLIPRQYKTSPVTGPVKEGIKIGGIKSQGISIAEKPKFSVIFGKQVIFSLLIMILALVAWGGIKGYTWYLDKNITTLDEEIQKFQEQQDLELAQKFISADKAIGAVESLLQSHVYSSQFFEILEKTTLPQVQWTGVNLDTAEGVAGLAGRAAGYSILAKQIVSFEESNFKISVSGIKLTKDGVEFEAKINFDPKILLR